jgi:hypothetical protein
LGVARAATNIFDWVGDIGIHLVDDHIQVLVEEPLAGVCETASLERIVLGDYRPFGEDFGVDVGCATGIVTRIDA